MTQSLTHKTAIVTGGASGMGAATARLLAQAGAHVLIVDRNGELATQVATAIAAPAPLIGDVSDSAFCERAVQTALDHYGRLDVLVNAAGIIVRGHALATTDDDWARILNVNLNGLFYMSRAAVRPMQQQRSGSIINFGSIWGTVGGKGHVAYCASKGAVHQVTKAMALDHAREGIRVNAVCPGEVDTPMLRMGGRSTPMSDAEAQALADAVVPMGRLAQPEEIARVVCFLASDDASYITGALVPVDAGYTAL
jgi:meso-butanediol dehydrogenase / (S,S)-butanediol dehydrogenase / diacetyl reductase